MPGAASTISSICRGTGAATGRRMGSVPLPVLRGGIGRTRLRRVGSWRRGWRSVAKLLLGRSSGGPPGCSFMPASFAVKITWNAAMRSGRASARLLLTSPVAYAGQDKVPTGQGKKTRERAMAAASLKAKVAPVRPRAQDVRPIFGAQDARAPNHAGADPTADGRADRRHLSAGQKVRDGITRIAAGRLYTIAQALGVDVGYFSRAWWRVNVQTDAAAAHAPGADPQFRQHTEPQAPGGHLQPRPGDGRSQAGAERRQSTTLPPRDASAPSTAVGA